jgi:hypothetical protein
MSGDSRSPESPRWLPAAVLGLVVLIVWTVTIKYLVPIHWFWAERLAGRSPAAAPVMWDAWPLAHLALVYLLWTRHRLAWVAGVTISAAEIVVVATKFAFFLRAPEPTFWRLLWFTNKLYVMLFFACLLFVLLGPGRRDLRDSAA